MDRADWFDDSEVSPERSEWFYRSELVKLCYKYASMAPEMPEDEVDSEICSAADHDEYLCDDFVNEVAEMCGLERDSYFTCGDVEKMVETVRRWKDAFDAKP